MPKSFWHLLFFLLNMTTRALFTSLICPLFLFVFSCSEGQQMAEQLSLEKRTIDLQYFKKEVLDFHFLDDNTDINVEYIVLDTATNVNLNTVDKCFIDNNFIYVLTSRNSTIYIFAKDGALKTQVTNNSINVGVISDFVVNDDILSIWDGKMDVINHFLVEEGGTQLTKKQEVKPPFEIDSFWQLKSGDYLTTTSSWNAPSVVYQLLKTDTDFNRVKEGYYRRLGYDDHNYIFANKFFHLYNDNIYVTHNTDNITFVFDSSGNVSDIVEILHGENAPKTLLSALEKNASKLSNYYFINHFIHIKNDVVTGKIKEGLSPMRSFVADTSSRTLYIEERPFTSIFSNTIGSYKDKIITILIPGQYPFVKEIRSIDTEVKNLLKEGKYVICLIEI